MQAETVAREQADYLIALHGVGAVGALLSRISDAVRSSDDQAVGSLDHILQIVEKRLEEPWRLSGSSLSRPAMLQNWAGFFYK